MFDGIIGIGSRTQVSLVFVRKRGEPYELMIMHASCFVEVKTLVNDSVSNASKVVCQQSQGDYGSGDVPLKMRAVFQIDVLFLKIDLMSCKALAVCIFSPIALHDFEWNASIDAGSHKHASRIAGMHVMASDGKSRTISTIAILDCMHLSQQSSCSDGHSKILKEYRFKRSLGTSD